jgi:MFS family permease
MNIPLLLLSICQGLFFTNNVIFISINGLVGLSLAPVAWMATLPLMGYVVGGALSTGIVAHVQSRYGRQFSFQIGLIIAALSALLCAYAVFSSNFWLLILATLLAGYYSANAQLYRFAAPELTKTEFRDKSVSWVLAGGLIGAILGPNLANWSRNLFSIAYVGAYLSLVLVAILAFTLMAFIRFPVALNASAISKGRSNWTLMSQPVFLVSLLGASLSYGVMNLLMGATPLAMQVCGYSFSETALVLEWHVIGMFAPGFFTGHVIKRFGTLPIMFIGLFLILLCIVIALSGIDFHQFFIALFVLGVGWNFLFTGSTSLAMQSYRPEEKERAQAIINFSVFTVMAFSSFASGALLTTRGWFWLNYGSLVPIFLIGVGLVWFTFMKISMPRKL